jgi:ferredoxin-NADP reductase
MISIFRKHIFNPAAFAVTLTALTGIGSASWWVGTLPMFPFLLLGVLIVRKIRRFDLVFYFFVTALLTIFGLSFLKGSDPVRILKATFIESPIFFFAFVMLTEPLTTPPTKSLQSIYGVLVGFFFSPQLQFGSLYTTPEIALLIGNIFSYLVSPKIKYLLTLKNKLAIGEDTVDFIFPRPKGFMFEPGQYMEWTLSHKATDSRGNRRYFTIASSPTEENVILGVKFYEHGSSYKKAMIKMEPKAKVLAGSLSGDFTLPKDKNKKLVFIAGGIGVTPFREIVKYLIDKNEKRDIVLLYSNKHATEIVYSDIFSEAGRKLGIKTVYNLTDTKSLPVNWRGKTGRITAGMIKEEIPDFPSRTFYMSGPQPMVDAYRDILKSMNIPDKQIITDYFPGYA